MSLRLTGRVAVGQDCGEEDYETWSPPKPDMCLLGRNVTMERRRRSSDCFNGKEYERAATTFAPCPCDTVCTATALFSTCMPLLHVSHQDLSICNMRCKQKDGAAKLLGLCAAYFRAAFVPARAPSSMLRCMSEVCILLCL